MFFKKKKLPNRVDCIDINAQHISTGQMGWYIKQLYEKEDFCHIGYEFVNKDGICRFVIYTLPNQKNVTQYFKDRCPAMVEQECLSALPVEFNLIGWEMVLWRCNDEY